jgi:hypothetical protein
VGWDWKKHASIASEENLMADLQEERKSAIPKSGLNPTMAPLIICPVRKCYRILYPVRAFEDSSDGQLKVLYYCESCNQGLATKAGFAAAAVHVQGRYVTGKELETALKGTKHDEKPAAQVSENKHRDKVETARVI